MEWMLWSYDKRYVTPDAIRQGTGLENAVITRAVRTLVATFGALRYNRHGEYEIVDLERYFDETVEKGAHARYHQRYL